MTGVKQMRVQFTSARRKGRGREGRVGVKNLVTDNGLRRGRSGQGEYG